jgi:hypothetical protein
MVKKILKGFGNDTRHKPRPSTDYIHEEVLTR